MTGEINSWETDKGYGMVRTSYGKLIGINWRQCPAYANQYSIKVGMKVKFKLGEFNKRATAIDCQFPELVIYNVLSFFMKICDLKVIDFR